MVNLGSILSRSTPETETKMPLVQEKPFLAAAPAPKSFETAAPPLPHYLHIHDRPLVGYKAGHTLRDLHLNSNSIFLHFQALYYEIEIHHLLKHSQALPLRCR